MKARTVHQPALQRWQEDVLLVTGEIPTSSTCKGSKALWLLRIHQACTDFPLYRYPARCLEGTDRLQVRVARLSTPLLVILSANAG
jgi:hypothetical protein